MNTGYKIEYKLKDFVPDPKVEKRIKKVLDKQIQDYILFFAKIPMR